MRSIAIGSIVIAMVVGGVAVPLSNAIAVDPEGARKGSILGVAIVLVATLFSLRPMKLLMSKDDSGVVSGWILGMVLRMPLCLASSAAVVKLLALPAAAVLGSMMVAYLLTLALETALMLRWASRSESN
jgi:presenilin-like A22 family membrane protease